MATRQKIPYSSFIIINVAAKVLGIKGLDKVEGNIANNLIKLLEDK